MRSQVLRGVLVAAAPAPWSGGRSISSFAAGCSPGVAFSLSLSGVLVAAAPAVAAAAAAALQCLRPHLAHNT
jgi:hypothetical protein